MGFDLGDVVRLRTSANPEFLRQSGGSNGRIIPWDGNDTINHWYRVNWDNGIINVYPDTVLEFLASAPTMVDDEYNSVLEAQEAYRLVNRG